MMTQPQIWSHCPYRPTCQLPFIVCAVRSVKSDKLQSRQWRLWNDSTSTYYSWTPQSLNTCWAMMSSSSRVANTAVFIDTAEVILENNDISRFRRLICFPGAVKYGVSDFSNWLHTVFVSILNAAPHFFLKRDPDLDWKAILWCLFSSFVSIISFHVPWNTI